MPYAIEGKAPETVSFAIAKKQFNQSVAELESALKDLKSLEVVIKTLENGELQRERQELQRQQVKASKDYTRITQQVNESEAYLAELSSSSELAQQGYRAHVVDKPSWWWRLLQRKKYKPYIERLAALKLTQEQILERQFEEQENKLSLVKQQKQQARLIQSLNAKIKTSKDKEVSLLAEPDRLKGFYEGVSVPDSETNIDDPDLQRNAYWQSKLINKLRSNVFVNAMALHQAWLFKALQVSHFRKQVLDLTDGLKRPDKIPDPEAMWRLFFMLVPVASTTFASVGRMLSGVSEEALGWLFIDEAGQAPPQQAVGAIMRAKRVLVVGDPLQIEPVFTTPPRLVETITERYLGKEAVNWSPLLTSVQSVADRANKFGCMLTVMDQEQWIGIPLWVHRRCIEPMFSLSNKIAYDNRMIHGLPDVKIQPQTVFGITNHWIDSKGECTVKQYKEELFCDTYRLVETLINGDINLEAIYIISPFKAVKEELKAAFLKKRIEFCHSHSIKLKDYETWLKNVGTVHTFQGKENDIVIFVLGCGPSNTGGAKWAGSKPNLLNVALTRAKKNIFVVSDHNVWSNISYFDLVSSCLPTKQVEEEQTSPV